ncbi:MAG: GGDEF domain-containing protein [Proteobacteria bacterium]|nr:GGDEF domain-containing protein [Pseudomonadota bacterium]
MPLPPRRGAAGGDVVELPEGDTDPGAAAVALRCAGVRRLADAVLSHDPRRRIRIAQWLISVLVYLGSAAVLWVGSRQGWVYPASFIAWCGFLVVAQLVVYIALRSGWSEHLADPGLTAAQIVLGVVAVEWGYVICGPARSVTLLPLLLIFTFGAFSLSWRRILWLTVFALTSLIAVAAALHAARPGSGTWALDHAELRIDLTNVMMIMILLPAISLVAARLSSLRTRLRSQRTRLTAALAEVQRLATHDELTALANRRHMQERLAQEQSRFQRSGHPFSIALIDLDHFKCVNDRHGHGGGDEVLRTFAREAEATLRSGDAIARWGGEEFLLLLPDTRAPEAQASVERLLATIRVLPLDQAVPLTFSAGVTEHRPGETVTETVARADRAMYAAKRAGRNRVVRQ